MIDVLKRLTGREKGMVAVAIVFVVVQVWLDLKLPDYMSTITTLVSTEGTEMHEVLEQGGYMLGCALGSGAAAVVVGYFAARVAAGLARTLRRDVYEHTLELSDADISRFSSASLLTRTTNDVTQIQNVIAMGLQAMVKAPIMAVWAVVKISGKSWQWSAATGVAVLVLAVIIGILIGVAGPRFRRVQALTDDLNRVTREQLTGIRVVRAYNAEEYQEAKFAGANDTLTRTNFVIYRVLALMSPAMTLISSGLTLSIYAIGTHLINDAALTDRVTLFSNMVVFSSYAMQIIIAFMLLTMVFFMLPRAQVAARRIMEVLDTAPSITDGDGARPSERGTVEFQDVTLRYEGASGDAIEHVTFRAEPGQTVAFIGATGAGKSTLINLVPRLRDTTSGRVLVDGVDVRDYALDDLRGRIGYVPQRSYLFSGTVASNVAYPRGGRAGADGGGAGSADEAALATVVDDALATAQATGFVAEMEGGTAAGITQGGTNVSGGQRQRLSIARALAGDPEILIFDDSFSALDYATDRDLRAALAARSPRATTLVVAQRIGTIRDADLILVLDDGKVVGQGTHDELLRDCPTYQEIASSQLSAEELAHA